MLIGIYSEKIWGRKKICKSMKNCASLNPKVNRRKRPGTIHFLTGTTHAEMFFLNLHIYFKYILIHLINKMLYKSSHFIYYSPPELGDFLAFIPTQ